MGEIGSEFWNSPIGNKENEIFPDSTQWFLSGRGALQSIIKELKNCRSAALPSWCCDSMVKPFIDAGIKVCFYPVYWQDALIQEIRLDCDVLFLMDYFGYSGAQPDLSGYLGVIIRDVTHTIFSGHFFDAEYCFGSLRKWCGVWTGGYAWAKDGTVLNIENEDDGGYTALRKRAMQQKNSYLHGFADNNSQKVQDKGYLALFEQAEAKLENLGALPAAERDVHIACHLNIENMKSRRRQNAEILRSAVSDWLIFPDMREDDCPMFVPVLVPAGQRDKLRRLLIINDIYCPVHWPVSRYHILDEQMQYIYENELSFVCDQRYTEKDMTRVVEVIKAFRQEV